MTKWLLSTVITIVNHAHFGSRKLPGSTMAAGVAAAMLYLRSALRYAFPNSRNSFLVDRTPYGIPVPRLRHKTLSKEELGERRLLIVGDVHGCCAELVQLLEECRASRGEADTCVVLVGDLVNKGPQSAEVVKLVRELGALSVRGNHDEVSLREWQNHCENGTELPAKFSWLKELSPEDLSWLMELPYTITIPSAGITVVHAGLVPGVALEEQLLDDMLNMRAVKCVESGGWRGCRKLREDSELWGRHWCGPQHVYFGHDARRMFQSHEFASGLDTGCVYGSKLTGVYPLEGNRAVQVEAHRVYVPKKT